MKKDYLEARTRIGIWCKIYNLKKEHQDLKVEKVFRSGCRRTKKYGWCAFVQYTEKTEVSEPAEKNNG